MKRAALAPTLVALAVLLAPVRVAQAAAVTGQVLDRAGKPVEYATVAAPALQRGTATDEQGRFALDLPPGPIALEVSQLGYERARVSVVVSESMAGLKIVLSDEPIPLAEVTVTTSSFGKAGKSEGAVVRRADIVQTPGGAADIFQALRALPGINAPNEGAAVYVRGGDPRETLIRLDTGEIGHPYHYEGASGGLFSAIDSYMLESAFFSSGGFSVRYGGVLSGVLDIQTQDPLDTRTVTVGANLAGGSLSSSWALVPGKLSLVGSIAHGVPELLFRLYGSSTDYEVAPVSMNALGKLIYRYSPSGRLTFEYLESHDQVGALSNYLNSESVYHSQAGTRLGAIQFKDVLAGRIALRGQVSGQWYDDRWSYSAFGARQTERNGQANLEAIWPMGPRHELVAGANLRRHDTEIAGRFPADSTDLLPGAPAREQLTRAEVDYPGVFVEDKLRLGGPLYATLGARVDYASTPGVTTFDPRVALAWRLDEHQTLRVAAGRYHQLADPRYLDPVFGNPDLSPLRADHVIAGYEWKSEFGNLRLEGYRKDYRDLVTNDSTRFYVNGGHGYARGVDAFVQGTYRWLSGWVSYGWMDTRRKELDDPREVPSRYGVDHSVTLVARYDVTSQWTIGAKYNYATGRRFTPVVGRTYDPGRDIYHPIYGDHNSDRLPDYRRLDLRVTRLFSLRRQWGLPESGACAFYVEGLNVLGIRNVLDYIYDSDYTRRYTTESYFSRRLLVAGFSLTW
jgi:hypothetical protein